MITCYDVANYFLSLQDEDAGDAITNLKLQKLVYYAQGFHLAYFKKPLFREKILAWIHGPVVRELYYKHSEHESGCIPAPDEFDDSIFSVEQIEFLNEIYKAFGQFSAWKLRNLIHEEPPWNFTDMNEEITHNKLIDYFQTQLIA